MTATEMLIRLQNLRADQSDMAQELCWPPAARVRLQRDAAALHQAITTLAEWGGTIEQWHELSAIIAKAVATNRAPGSSRPKRALR